MQSTMQDCQLTIQALFLHGARIHARSGIAGFDGQTLHHTTYAAVASRAARLANVLRNLGIRPGDRVGTFCWNTLEHLEAYLAVASMGAVLHTNNVRLHAEQLAYIVNDAGDRIMIVDSSNVPAMAKASSEFRTVERYLVIGRSPEPLRAECLDYEEQLAAASSEYDWPEIDERSAAGMCYTSGTTGNPKGVVYSHRSTYLHALVSSSAGYLCLSDRDGVLVVPSMFHANAWGLPHSAWLAGADIVLPGRHLQGEPLCRMIAEERPTVSAGVPTIWNEVLRYADAHPTDLSSIRMILGAGSAVPRSLIEGFRERHGVRVVQGWGMTETSPLMTMGMPPKTCGANEEVDYHATGGRLMPGCEMRIVTDDGQAASTDGQTVGEVEVRGLWVTASYYGDDSGEKFHDGWLRTGDVGTLDEHGYLRLKDRTKDVIKSGGEWVSSLELENAIMAHPDVMESAVIGVPDLRWDERPLACVVLREGATATACDLRAFLLDRVAKWWIPERWAFLPEVPRTSVGKFDKKRLRARYADGQIDVVNATEFRAAGRGD